MEAVTSIYRHYVLETTATFELEPPELPEINHRRTEVLRLGLPYLVAEAGTEVIGYAYAGTYRARVGYRFSIENSIYLHPAFLGKGAGKILMRELIARCELGPWRQMVAVIGGTDNAASVRLHMAFGFRHIGTLNSVGYKFGKWIDTVLMQRPLGRGDLQMPAEAAVP